MSLRQHTRLLGSLIVAHDAYMGNGVSPCGECFGMHIKQKLWRVLSFGTLQAATLASMPILRKSFRRSMQPTTSVAESSRISSVATMRPQSQDFSRQSKSKIEPLLSRLEKTSAVHVLQRCVIIVSQGQLMLRLDNEPWLAIPRATGTVHELTKRRPRSSLLTPGCPMS